MSSEKVLEILQKHLAILDEHITELGKEIESKVVAHYQDLFKVLSSIPGIGRKTATALLIVEVFKGLGVIIPGNCQPM